MMKRITILLIALIPLSCWAHPCPYDWNVEFEKTTTIRGESYAEFAKLFNEAVSKETKGVVKKAIVLESKADSLTKVPEDSEFAGQMDVLFRRYKKRTDPLIAKGVWQYGAAPLEIEFPGRFPVACLLSGRFEGRAMRSVEAEEGLMVTIQRRLECRAYRLSESFLRVLEEEKRADVNPAMSEAAQRLFAQYGGVMCEMTVQAGLEKSERVSILNGVTLHIPERRVMLVLESEIGHERLIRVMGGRGYIEGLSDAERALIPEDDGEVDPFGPPR